MGGKEKERFRDKQQHARENDRKKQEERLKQIDLQREKRGSGVELHLEER